MRGSVPDPGQVGRGLCPRRADADGVTLPGDSDVADVNIVAADGEIVAGRNAERDVAAARRIRTERTDTARNVVAAGRVAVERSGAVGGIIVARRVRIERRVAAGGVSWPVEFEWSAKVPLRCFASRC